MHNLYLGEFPYLFKKNFVMMLRLCAFLFIGSFVFASQISAQNISRNLWERYQEPTRHDETRRFIIPTLYNSVRLDIASLKSNLISAPMEKDVVMNRKAGVVIELPMPGGEFLSFNIMEAPIMHPDLSAKYPEIKTYRGQGIEDKTATIRFDLTPAGFHAMVMSASGTWYIDPYSLATTENYISYWKKDLPYDESREFIEEGPLDTDSEVAREISEMVSNGIQYSIGEELRTYRTAIATTGEYTAFHGGTVAQGLAAVVTALNRVNLIYENEVAVRMVLIANNDTLIYTNSSTDPYTNTNGSTMLGQNQTNIDNIIGNANYDFGHVFSTGGGGIASLGVPCRTGFKARGVTGLPNPIGDPFFVDYVAHEMGHQFGANHTFNGSSGNCSGGNRNGSTAYEPGSGSTVMAYAGICGSQNLQSLSNDYFHGVSIDEIVAYTTLGFGNLCPTLTVTGNTAPISSAGSGGFTIPINTPFSLTGSGTDSDNDSLTYCWEQFDLGAAGHPNSPVGNAPIFRTFLPVSSPTRVFPRISNLINNTQTIGEILPSYTRGLNFRLTVRDNKSGGGGVAKSNVAFNVTADAGPFVVTSHNTNTTLMGLTFQTITWDVANTDASPVNVSNVNILLSTDGGNTFPHVLLSNTPNDGTEDITLPNVATTQARIKVEAVGNIFFDISNTNFTITDNPVPVELTSFSADVLNSDVELRWITATEVNNSGFSVERSS
jgi:hypothetical protein